jgi:hypothetical protein
MNAILVAVVLVVASSSSSSSSSTTAPTAPGAASAAPVPAAPGSSPPSPTPSSSILDRIGGGDPVFTRDEPALAAARRALLAGDVDLAVDRAREAVSSSPDERAVVEFDAAQALRARARKDAAANAEAASSSSPPSSGAPAAPPSPPNLDEAIASFERAAGLAVDRRLQSEARLAAGNAALEAGKLDDAIAALRKAVVADPTNDRARHNLQRALQAKKAQPPPPPQQGGDGDPAQDDQKEEQQDQQKDQQKEQQKDPQQQQTKKDAPEDNAGGPDEPKPDAGNGADPPKDGGADEPKPADQKPQDGSDQPPTEAKKPRPTKDEGRRLLQGIRSRERPLTPMEMRGVAPKRAREGKDW